METVKQVSQTDELEQAELRLCNAKSKTKDQQEVGADLRAKLDTEREFLKTLETRYDRECVNEDSEAAKQSLNEIVDARIRVHGLELRLADVEKKIVLLRADEKPLLAEFQRHKRNADIEAERQSTKQMVEEAQASYDNLEIACQRFEKSILALKQYSFIDSMNKNQASDTVFRVTTKVKGFNF